MSQSMEYFLLMHTRLEPFSLKPGKLTKSYMLNSSKGINITWERKAERENNISRKYIPLYYFHHLHQPCFLEQQMGNFLDLKDLPAEGFSYDFKFVFHLRNHKTVCKGHKFSKSLLQQIVYLNKEFFPPVVKVVKWFHWINIIHKNTAISTPIESNTKALESLLPSCIPDLSKTKESTVNPHWRSA